MGSAFVRLVGGVALMTGVMGATAPPLSAQAVGTVRGRVVTAAGQVPLGAVQIRVEGTALGAMTREDGTYTLPNVPSGPATLSTQRIGYQRATRTVTVTPGASVTADFELQAAALSLEEVVVTATGEERRREIGNSIASVNAAAVAEEGTVTNVAELLTGRAAGVQVLPSSGTTGMGSRIRIRGSNSVSLSNEPIVFVDGVRISGDAGAISFETGGDAPSRLNDINPDEIENIEVIKGPSAATLYGTDAANGVIWITTKRGRAGETRWNAFTERGAVVDPYTYAASYRGIDEAGGPCRLFDVAAERCTQARVLSLNPLEEQAMSPFRTGSLAQYGLSVSGGQEALRYFISGDLQQEDGVLRSSALQRVNTRANVDAQLSPTINTSVSVGYLTSDLTLPMNGNYELGLIGNGLASQGTPDLLGGWGFFPQEQLLAVDSRQNVDRFTGSVRLNWLPRDFLTGRLTIGLDQVSRVDDQWFPTGQAPAWLGYDAGARFVNRFQNSTYTLDALTSGRAQLSSALTSETSVGVQYVRELLAGTLASGRQLVAGSRSISAAAETESSERTTENVKLGAFVQQQLGFRDRLFVTAAVRADDASAFGQNYDLIAYPKVSGSWVVSEEPFFPQLSALNSLRLRAAWGTSGLQPGTVDALRYFQPISVTTGGASVTGVTFGGLGNPLLKPERSSELEAGFDAQFWENRLALDFTYYNKRTNDALILRQLPPSLGVSTGRFENLGSVRNSGVEAHVVARLVQTERASWDVTLNGALNENELLSLGEGIPPIIVSGVQRHVVGYPLGGYWDFPITSFADADGDGIIAQSEVQVGEEVAFLGTPFPKQQLSIRNDVSLFGWLRVAALFDFRGGMRLHNNTEAWRNGQNITRALNDPSAPLAEQARAVASAFLGSDAGYIEDASFWKFRELSLTFGLPNRLLQRVGGREASLVLAGRNLGVWTDYTGIDPEVNQSGQANFVTSDFMNQAPVRYFTARLNLAF